MAYAQVLYLFTNAEVKHKESEDIVKDAWKAGIWALCSGNYSHFREGNRKHSN